MLEVYTDGSCHPNPGPGGAALVWRAPNGDVMGKWHGPFPGSTNNRMELMAIKLALEEFPDQKIKILSDSEYSVNSVRSWMFSWEKRGWVKSDGKPVMNVELMKELHALVMGRKEPVLIQWVKGHSYDQMNIWADECANLGRNGVDCKEPKLLATPEKLAKLEAEVPAKPIAARALIRYVQENWALALASPERAEIVKRRLDAWMLASDKARQKFKK